MADQVVKNIKLSELVLWSENPRDKIDEKSSNQKIVDQALLDTRSKWSLAKLAKEMGDSYDFSELPTVVYLNEKPVVYDGNRRMILGKIKQNLVKNTSAKSFEIPDFPNEIPCNVCVEDVALKNILRKHGDSGSWSPLERDIFLHKHMHQPKSPFLILDEGTALITNNPHLNKGFVKDEIFKEDTLKSLGFEIKNGKLYSKHNDEDSREILVDLSNKIQQKEISTRRNRGDVMTVLEKKTRKIIEKNKTNQGKLVTLNSDNRLPKTVRHTPRVPTKQSTIFGGKLALKPGDVNTLYRDIVQIYEIYNDGKYGLSPNFIGLIRMSLRPLLEMSAQDLGLDKFDKYIEAHFDDAKKMLSQDEKTTIRK